MLLYLVRHAEAKSKEEDPERPLSVNGYQDIRRIASYASGLKLRVSEIFQSGKLRAKETAEVLSDYLSPVNGISEADGLAPLDEPALWAERLKDIKDDVMLVGHLPHLERLASLLLAGDKDKKIVAFSMAGIVCLERDEGVSWFLKWMITPEIVL